MRTINSEMIIITDKLNHKLSNKAIVIAQAIDAACDTLLIWWAEAVCYLIEVWLYIYNWVNNVYLKGNSWICYTGGKCWDALWFVLPSLDASGKLYCSPGLQAFYIVILTSLLLSWFYRKRRQHRDYVMNSYLYGASQAAWAAGIGYSSPHSDGSRISYSSPYFGGSSNRASPSMNTPDRTSGTGDYIPLGSSLSGSQESVGTSPVTINQFISPPTSARGVPSRSCMRQPRNSSTSFTSTPPFALRSGPRRTPGLGRNEAESATINPNALDFENALNSPPSQRISDAALQQAINDAAQVQRDSAAAQARQAIVGVKLMLKLMLLTYRRQMNYYVNVRLFDRKKRMPLKRLLSYNNNMTSNSN